MCGISDSNFFPHLLNPTFRKSTERLCSRRDAEVCNAQYVADTLFDRRSSSLAARGNVPGQGEKESLGRRRLSPKGSIFGPETNISFLYTSVQTVSGRVPASLDNALTAFFQPWRARHQEKHATGSIFERRPCFSAKGPLSAPGAARTPLRRRRDIREKANI